MNYRTYINLKSGRRYEFIYIFRIFARTNLIYDENKPYFERSLINVGIVPFTPFLLPFNYPKKMKKVRITAMRQTVYADLMAKYENPIQHTCDVREGQQWVSVDGRCPEGMCPSAWESMRGFVESLARGEGNFYDGWMQNPMSAMISCNDGFRPFSFYIEAIDD